MKSEALHALCTGQPDTSMTLEIEMRYVYGLQTFYPVCEKSKVFARIAGTTTLTKPCRDDIKSLGYSFKVLVPETLV